jgi:hypothetical protein
MTMQDSAMVFQDVLGMINNVHIYAPLPGTMVHCSHSVQVKEDALASLPQQVPAQLYFRDPQWTM